MWKDGFCNPSSQDTIKEESDWYFGADAAFTERYLWRGAVWNQGVIVQPQVYAGYKDFSVYIWGNVPIWDINDTPGNEIDVYFDYYHSFSFIDFESALNLYTYPGQDEPGTLEFFIGLFYPIGDFTLFADLNIDILSCPGSSFYEFGIDFEKELINKFTVSSSLSGGVGSKKFNACYFEIEKSAFNYLAGRAGVTYSILDGFMVDLNYYYDYILDDEIKQATKDIYGLPSSAFELKFRKEF